MLTKMRCLTIALLIIIFGQLSVGLVMIYSTTYEKFGNFYFYRQMAWIVLGIASCIAITFVREEWIAKYSHFFLIAILLALGYLVLCRGINIAFGKELAQKMPFIPGEIKGGFRWLRFKGITIQPSELAKLGLLLFLGSYYGTRKEDVISKFMPGVGFPFLLSGAVLACILFGKDLSSTVITALMVFSMMFLAGVRLRFLLPILALGILLGVTMIVTSPMRMKRIISYRQPATAGQDPGARYQLDHSQMALGSGGLRGRGFTKSLMKNEYLPEAHTDFIAAVLGEELGFLGISSILLLYTLFFFAVFGISLMCRDRMSMLLCQGVAILIPFQALTNLGVVSGFVPTTGLTAPFLSYGGSSILSTMLCCGMVFNVALRTMTVMTAERERMSVIPTRLARRKNKIASSPSPRP